MPLITKLILAHFVGDFYFQPLKPYLRLDFMVAHISGKKEGKTRHRWSLDIQNVLNIQNDGFRYYDPYLNTVLLQNQLGMIPVLSYKVEWANIN